MQSLLHQSTHMPGIRGVTIALFTAVRKIQAAENVKSEIWPFRTLAE